MSAECNTILCRYHEIATKGNNRNMFEKCLMDHLQFLLKDIPGVKAKKVRGRVWVNLADGRNFSEAELGLVREKFLHAFGLETFSPGVMCRPDIDEIRGIVARTSPAYFEPRMASGQAVSFRIRANRSDKRFPLTSKDIEINLAEVIGGMYEHEKLRVDLEKADITVGCELREEFAFVFHETCRGPGGLPLGSNAPVLALLSGGIDSPVACYLMMKRGCRVDFITFHSAPYTPPETLSKVRGIVEHLSKFQGYGRLFACNLAPMQKLIRDKCQPRLRTVLYRRMMLRIAEAVARRRRRFALVTGDSIGQVASQTIININTINEAAKMVVLRPLVTMDKLEAIRIAERIGSFVLSKTQVPDSCTVFAPPSPATAAHLGIVLEDEENLGDYSALLEEIINGIEVF
ncbi:MAG: tRNA 4-thiouridine(8) synthase ThiI [Lentisphaerae bacterium GWF2_52_8]|nr:MAG: tRNA 4-thiouridine(8) synthase ThiI [Lentisphaerae bacterium GWF2_52_8]